MKTINKNVIRKIFKLALLLAIITGVSCSPENLDEPQTSDRTLIQGPRPITNSLESDPDPNGPPPFGESIFSGRMSHLGKVTGVLVVTSIIPDIDGNLDIITEDVIIAANGDELYSTSVIKLDPTNPTMATAEGGATFNGGTGRFENATGFLIFENMVFNLVTGHESHTSYGEITY